MIGLSVVVATPVSPGPAIASTASLRWPPATGRGDEAFDVPVEPACRRVVRVPRGEEAEDQQREDCDGRGRCTQAGREDRRFRAGSDGRHFIEGTATSP
jgi:hypothetical protein